MAKSQSEQLRDLTDAFARADAQLRILDMRVAAQEEEIKRMARRDEEQLTKLAVSEAQATRVRAELDATKDDLRRALERIAVTEARNAALEERARGQEKTTDRGWQLWLAALAFGFSLISLLVTAALQLKK